MAEKKKINKTDSEDKLESLNSRKTLDVESAGLTPFMVVVTTVASYLMPQVIIGFFLVFYMQSIGVTDVTELLQNNNFLSMIVAISAYALGIVIILWVVRNVSKKSVIDALSLRPPKPLSDTLLAFPGFMVYLFVVFIFFSITGFFSPETLEQTQELSFTEEGSGYDILFAFIALVLAAPIAEEIIYRGFLFQGLAKRYGFWIGTIATGLIFGLAHWQWNVGIDTFALTIVASYLVWNTKSIWPAILLHMIKNLMAFAGTFLLDAS